MLRLLLLLLALLPAGPALAQAATRAAFLDERGVIRWRDNRREVAPFGANCCLPSACDYRAAGYAGANHKQLVEQDMAHFARLDFDALRLCFWGNYENTDPAGNLVANDHLDLLNYLVAQAKSRCISMLPSPIVTYSSQRPDAMHDTTRTRGISMVFKKEELGTNPKAIVAQCTDAVPVADPFNMPSPGKVVVRTLAGTWLMRVRLPDFGPGERMYDAALPGRAVEQVGSRGRIFKLRLRESNDDFHDSSEWIAERK